MEAGFIMDHGHGMSYQSSWIEGEPVWSKWLGLRIKGKRRMKVVTYRCTSCGRLESFATAESGKHE